MLNRLLITVLMLASVFPAWARMRFNNIDVSRGLSSNQVNVVMKDSRGFMWFGTASGLDRYDGYGVKSFQSNPDDTTAIHDNYIRIITEGPDGKLYVRAGEGYSVYTPETQKFHHFGQSDLQIYGLKSEPLIMEGTHQKLFITERGGGIVAWDPEKGGERVADPTGKLDSRATTGLHALPDRNMLAAVHGDGSLFIIDTRLGKVVRSVEAPAAMKGLDEEVDVFVDNEGLAWVYSIKGVYIYDPLSRQWKESLRSLLAYPSQPVTAVVQAQSGRILVGHDKEGLEVIGKSGEAEFYVHDDNDPYSLCNNVVRTIFIDREEGIWVATYKKGISYYNKCQFPFDNSRIFDVNCIAPKGEKEVWIGTDSQGLLSYNVNTRQVTRHVDPTAAQSAPIVALLPDKEGHGVWVATYAYGLKHFDGQQFTHYGVANGLAQENVWALRYSPRGTIYIGTLGKGLQELDPQTGKFTTWNAGNSGLGSEVINTLTVGECDTMFIGTTYGVFAMNMVDNSIGDYLNNKPNEPKLSNLNINQIYYDSRGLLWIATREGLDAYDTATKKMYHVDLREDGSRTFVRGIVEDTGKTIWVTIDHELISLTPSKNDNGDWMFDPTLFDQSDGINVGDFNQRSFCTMPDGEILVGGLNGIVHVIPDEITYNKYVPKVIFTDITQKEGQEFNINLTDEITLNPDQNSFTIYFATDNYIHSQETGYEYRLVGLSDKWQTCEPGTHSATFTALAPGDYTFEVKAVNNNGVASEGIKSVKIKVLPPFWLTWWAKTIYIILALGLMFGVYKIIKYRERQRFAEKRRLEDVMKQVEINESKSQFFTNISHELRTPLTLILAPVESMIKETPDGQDLTRLNTIKTNANRLLYLVNQLLDFRKSEMAGLGFRPKEGDVVEILRTVTGSFADLATTSCIELKFAPEVPKVIMDFDAEKLGKAMVNLISNAIKFTPKGGEVKVWMSAPIDGRLIISVSDTGSGVSYEDKPHIFDRFYRSSTVSPGISGSGIGLSLVHEYIKLHSGTIEVSDNTPKGAIFTIILPVKATEAEMVEIAEEIRPEPSTKPSIMIVDDNRDMLTFLSGEFGDEFDVVTAASGPEALEIISHGADFDLIICDIMMPEMSGIELFRILKSKPQTANTPVMMLTAKDDPKSVVEGLTLGADDYVVKPFDNEVLRLRIRRLTGLKRAGVKRPLIEPQVSNVEITSLDSQLIEKAVKYVERNISRTELSVEEMARDLGMSRVHLYKKLLALTGKSPTEFIRLLRLKRACQYLRESQLNVSEIAYKVGFNSPKYFSRYFKDEYGISPSAYQAQETAKKG